jgi:hypothetical protein
MFNGRLQNMRSMNNFPWPRVRDLPENERQMFTEWLVGQTRPVVPEVSDSDQDAYYPWDYDSWKNYLAGHRIMWD